MNTFSVRCRSCRADIVMDQGPTGKWRPMEREVDGRLVIHRCPPGIWYGKEETVPRPKTSRVASRQRVRLALDVSQQVPRTVVASDNFEDDIPWR